MKIKKSNKILERHAPIKFLVVLVLGMLLSITTCASADPITGPVANFSAYPTEGSVPLFVQFTDRSENATVWSWDFGDGTNSTVQNPVHIFWAAGNYTVNLTASNMDGTDSTFATISVLKQTPYIDWYTPADIAYGTALSAIQLNANAFSIPGTFVYTPAAGTVLSPGTQTLHVDFTPTDTVNYNTASADVQINVKLVLANFSSNVTSGFAPLSVQFTDLSENAEAVAWDFGDGNNSADRNPIHEFATPGTYIVNLTATNGTYIDSKFATINVLGHSGGPDNYNYTFKDSDAEGGPTYDWIEISETGNQILNNSDDSVQGDVDLGFFFSYYGTDYSRLAITNNGLLFSSGIAYAGNDPIGQSPNVHGFISPFWDDLVTYNGGKIYYQTLGTAPNRIFVTEWVDNQHFPSSDSGITFESILYEGSNNIKFQYKDVSFGNNTSSQYDNGGSATVGIESPEGNDGLQYSFNEQVIDPGKAILFMFPQFTDDPSVPPSRPVANFSSNVSEGYAPLSVQFTDLSENAASVNWDFGDGNNSTERNPVHEFTIPGIYTVRLTAINGNRTNSKAATINVVDHSGGPGNYNYTFKDSDAEGGPTYDWIEISETGNQILNNSDDSVQGDVDLGFFFSYYGTDYSRLAITNNGLLFSSGIAYAGNDPIGQSPNVHGFISPFWDDLVTYNGGKIYYQTLGTAPNRIFVTEWVDNQHFPSSDSGITFESILYEGSNNIKFQYKDVSFGNNTSSQYDNGGSATVGIESPDGNDGLQYSFNEQAIDSGKAILFFIDGPSVPPSPPVANFSSSVTSGSTPLDVQFTDLSENAEEWNWNFGDGATSDQQNPTHTYSAAGNYTITLTVSNSAGSDTVTKQDYIVASIESPDAIIWGVAPLSLQFTDQSVNATSWYWTFGDGTNSTEQNPTHTYTKAGQYGVSVKVTNSAGANTAKYTGYINVVNSLEPPIAAFSASPTYGKMPLSVSFIDDSTGSPTSWKWSFGDGTNSTEQNPTHTYTEAGQYAVTLTASNVAGSNAITKLNYISVGNSVEAPVTAFSVSVIQ